GTRIELRPQLARLRDGRQFGAITGCSNCLPLPYRSKLIDLFQPVQNRSIGQVVEFFTAKIVVATLHVADLQPLLRVWTKDRALQRRNIFVEELLLQVLRSSRNDHPQSRTNDGHKIRKCLAGAGSSFDDQMSFLGERLFHGLCHLQLSAPELIRRMGFGEHTAWSEELVKGERTDIASRSCCGL